MKSWCGWHHFPVVTASGDCGIILNGLISFSLLFMQGVASSKRDGFSLTSGDFPTLGSEKDNSGKNNELQGLIHIVIKNSYSSFCHISRLFCLPTSGLVKDNS